MMATRRRHRSLHLLRVLLRIETSNNARQILRLHKVRDLAVVIDWSHRHFFHATSRLSSQWPTTLIFDARLVYLLLLLQRLLQLA